jgi:hypothetical protein
MILTSVGWDSKIMKTFKMESVAKPRFKLDASQTWAQSIIDWGNFLSLSFMQHLHLQLNLLQLKEYTIQTVIICQASFQNNYL